MIVLGVGSRTSDDELIGEVGSVPKLQRGLMAQLLRDEQVTPYETRGLPRRCLLTLPQIINWAILLNFINRILQEFLL